MTDTNIDLQSITSDTELKALLWDQQEALETLQANVRAIQARREQLQAEPPKKK